MLQAIRDRATGWIAYGIIILICIPFAFWGIQSYVSGGVQLNAAEVGDTEISVQEVQRAYQQQRSRLQNMLGDNYNPALFDEDTLKHQALQQLIDNTILIQTAEAQGMRVSNQQLQRAIQDISAFQEEGRFSAERYQRMLRVQGYTAPSFEESLRQDLMTNQLRSGLIDSSLLTKAEIEQLAELLYQKRDISYLQLSLEDYQSKVEVDEAEIEKYFEDNKNRFMSPERIKLQYLELTLEAMASGVNISDEEIESAYQEQLSQYTQEEERKASHILLNVAEDASTEQIEEIKERAQALYEEIKNGTKTFDQALTESEDQDGFEAGELGIIYKDVMEASFEDALYSLEKAGDISEPIKTSSGFHIIRLDDLKPEVVKSLEEVKDEIAQSLKIKQAESYFFDSAENLANLSFENPDSLQPAAEALDLKIAESDWLTRAGSENQDNLEESIANYPQVVQAAFGSDVLQNGMNSTPLEVEPSHVIVIRKLEHQEPAPLNLEEARDDIVAQIKADKARENLQQDIDSLLEKAKQGTDLETLASEIESEVKSTGLISRTDGSVDSAIRTEAFQLSAVPTSSSSEENQTAPLAIGSAVLANGDQAIIAVTNMESGKLEDIDESEQEAFIGRLTSQIGSSQFDSLLQNRRQQTDVVTHNDRL